MTSAIQNTQKIKNSHGNYLHTINNLYTIVNCSIYQINASEDRSFEGSVHVLGPQAATLNLISHIFGNQTPLRAITFNMLI